MKAVRIHSPGGPRVLRYEDVETPTPGPGQVLVKVRAAGVNFIDTYHRTGLYPVPLPATLGQEGAGVVVATGPGAGEFSPGQPVAWGNAPGSYADYIVAAADRLVPLPEGVSFTQGAAAMLQGMTAHYLTMSTRPLGPGDACLVHAAAGGVGLLLCQLARLRGARVIGTAGTDEKAALALQAGADSVVVYSRQDFVAEVLALTSGEGVQVVYDGVGRDTFEGSLACLARRGMLVLFGQSSGPVPPFDPLLLSRRGSLFLTRPSLAHYIETREELLDRAAQVFDWVKSGGLRIRIGLDLPLSRADDAHRQLEARLTTGKIILVPDG